MGSWLMVIGTSGLVSLLWVWIGGVLWVVVQVVGSHHAMGFGCSYSGVDTEGVEVKIPFDKRPKTRVQGVGFYALCGDVVPLPSSGSVLPGWWCAWSWGWVSSVLCLPLRRVYLLRAWGWMAQLVLGLWVTG